MNDYGHDSLSDCRFLFLYTVQSFTKQKYFPFNIYLPLMPTSGCKHFSFNSLFQQILPKIAQIFFEAKYLWNIWKYLFSDNYVFLETVILLLNKNRPKNYFPIFLAYIRKKQYLCTRFESFVSDLRSFSYIHPIFFFLIHSFIYAIRNSINLCGYACAPIR